MAKPVSAEDNSKNKEVKTPDNSALRSLNVYQKVAAITGEIEAIEKSGRNNEQGYDFIPQSAVVAALRPKMAKYELVVIQNPTSYVLDEVGKTYKGGAIYKAKIAYDFEVVNATNPTDKFTIKWHGEANDSGDKATSKAATSAEKYCLMKLFKISDAIDPDAADAIPQAVGNANHKADVTPAAKPVPVKKTERTLVTTDQLKDLYATAKAIGYEDKETVDKYIKSIGEVNEVSNLPIAKIDDVKEGLEVMFNV